MGTMGSQALGDVNLEWRPAFREAEGGETVNLGLYAVAEQGEESMVLIQAILTWNADFMTLVEVDDTGGPGWQFSGFRDDQGLDDLNGSFEDGDAFYFAWIRPGGDPVNATEEGTLVATFRFDVSGNDPGSPLEIPERFGEYSRTGIVGGGEEYDVTGALGMAELVLVGGCSRDPAWICDGDVDGDGQVNPVDAGLVQAAFGSPDPQDLCQYDMDCDGQVNPVDAGIVQAKFGTCDPPRNVCP
jgi:hypothetical protein